MERKRTWWFTVENYKDEDVDKIKELQDKWDVTDIIASVDKDNKEVPSINGFIRFKTVRSAKQVKKVLGEGASVEIATSTLDVIEAYLIKGSNVLVDYVTTSRNRLEKNQRISKKQKENVLLKRIMDSWTDPVIDTLPSEAENIEWF